MLAVSDRTQAVLVGDRMHDAEGARVCGIDCIGVTFGFGGEEELRVAGINKIARDMQELKRLLLA